MEFFISCPRPLPDLATRRGMMLGQQPFDVAKLAAAPMALMTPFQQAPTE
jgi:hypothetical protein